MANKNISGDVNVEFTETQSRQSLESGESVKTLFGKLRKWLTDLKAVAFSGSYNDLSNKPSIPSTEVTETSDTTPYLYKSSEHDAVYDELVGGSVAWNQLVANSGSSLSVTITSGHKYVMKKSGTLSVGASGGSAITGLTGGTDWITDLTLMFGSTTIADYVYNLEQSTAGSGVEWLKSYGFFTKDYYAYNAESLVSVNTSGKKVTGKNLLKLTISPQTTYGVTYISDSETGIVTATGTGNVSSGAQYRIPIPAELVGNYYFSALTTIGSDSTYDAYVWCDTDGARAKKWNGTTNSSSDFGNGNCEIRLEAGKTYTLNLRVKNGITVNNLVFKPMIRRADVTDSTFEPYTSLTYLIQSTDLRGLFKLNGNKMYADGDIYPADGNGTRKYEIADLGTLNWKIATQSRFISSGIRSSVKIPSSTAVAFKGVCQKYLAASNTDVYYHTVSNSMAITGDGDVVIYDVNYSSYADANAFKAAMSGVCLIYELATPTTAIFAPFTSPQMIYRNGTEEYLDTRDMPVPVGGNRKYVDIPDWMVNEYFDDCRTQLERAISDPETFCDSINALQTTGGTMTGDLTMNVGTAIKSNNGKNRLSVDNTQSYLYSTGIGSNTGLVDVWLSGNQPEILIRCEDSANNQYKYISLSLYSFRIKSNAIRWDGDNSALPTGTGTNLVIDSDGYFKKALSSRNVKHDISYVEDTNDYHDALMQMKPATFIYNSDKTETQKLGMIAEDVADVCPIAGITDKNGKVENYDDRAIIAMLVAEVQRLNAEIDKLKGR